MTNTTEVDDIVTNDYKDENILLLLGDCVLRMKYVPSESVDCVITDAPYGIDFSEWDILHNNKNSALLGKSPANMECSVFRSRGKPLNGWHVSQWKFVKEGG